MTRHEKGDFQYGCLLNIGVRMGVFGCFKIQRNILQNSAQIKKNQFLDEVSTTLFLLVGGGTSKYIKVIAEWKKQYRMINLITIFKI